VYLDVIFCGRHLENFNDGNLKVKGKNLKKNEKNEKCLNNNKRPKHNCVS